MRLSLRLLSLLAIPSLLQIFSFALLGNLEEHAQQQLRIAENARTTSTALDTLMADVYQTLKQHSNERDLELDAANAAYMPLQLKKLDLDMKRLEMPSAGDDKYAGEINELRSIIAKISYDYGELVKNFASKRETGFLERKGMWTALATDSRTVTARTADLFARERAIEEEAAKNQQKDRNATRVILYSAALCSFLSILAVSLFVMRKIVSKVNVLVENTKLLVNNKSLNEPLGGSDELSLLDQTFHEMAESLRDANYRERAVLDNALDAILVLDDNLQITKCNPATVKLFRMPEVELKKLSIDRFIQKDKMTLAVDYFSKAKKYTAQPPLEIQIFPPRLSAVDTLWTIRWSENDKQFFCVAHDLSERMAAERLRDEAISMLNHDLRSPLTSIQLTFDLILETLKSQKNVDSISSLVERGYSNCSRVLALTNELLDWDKYRSGQVKLRRAKCDLAQIILFAGETLEPQFKSKSIDFIADLDSVFVDGDGVELERVVLNLLSNSIKFSPINSALRVESSIEGNFGQICISDQGPGIAETKLDKIFDRFFQLEQQRSTGEGAGLGLAICRLIVEMHGGKIGHKADWAKEVISFFRFLSIKIKIGANLVAKILIVEDDLSLAEDLQSSLKLLGHTAECAHCGEDALQLLTSFDFDVIILDWDLPGISGLEVCQEFRKNDGIAAILFLTGHNQIDDKESGFESGADDYLTKPFAFKELSLRVDALLRRRRMPLKQELCIDQIRLNIQKRALFIKETEYYLTPKETALLEFLMRNPNQAFNADALLRAVWPSNSEGSVASVRSWMRLLRQKFQAGGQPEFIKTLPGSGYIIESL